MTINWTPNGPVFEFGDGSIQIEVGSAGIKPEVVVGDLEVKLDGGIQQDFGSVQMDLAPSPEQDSPLYSPSDGSESVRAESAMMITVCFFVLFVIAFLAMPWFL